MKIMRFNNRCSVQAGAALITSLIFLTILTILGMSTLGTAMLESRMAGNSRDKNIAFQAAEAALRDAEQYIQNSGRICGLSECGISIVDDSGYGETGNTVGLPSVTCAHGLCYKVPGMEYCNSAGSQITAPANAALWDGAIQYYRDDAMTGKPIGTETLRVPVLGTYTLPENGIPFVRRQPEYVIEAFPKNCELNSGEYYYRITVRGYGRFQGTLVQVQEVYKPAN